MLLHAILTYLEQFSSVAQAFVPDALIVLRGHQKVPAEIGTGAIKILSVA